MPNTRNQVKNSQEISPDTSRINPKNATQNKKSQEISRDTNPKEISRVQISLRISRDISSNLDAVVSQSPLNRNEWIEQAIAEKLLIQQQEESRLDRLERQMQMLLMSRKTKVLTYQGRSMTIREWASELGIAERTIRTRLERGKSVEEALKVG